MVNTSDGATHTLYDQTWTAGVWSDGVNHANTSLSAIAPAIVATSGASDLLVVYVASDTKLMAMTRAAGTWSAPAIVDANAFTNDPPALAAMSNGRAVLAYRGSDGKAYASTYDPSGAAPWSAPVSFSGGATLASVPSVATGV